PGDDCSTGAGGESYVRTWALHVLGHRWPFRARRWAREICARAPDLIEAGDAGPEAWAALHAARALDVPLIGFCHSDVVRMEARRLGSTAANAIRTYAREIYRRCDVVVAPSEFMCARLADWGVDRAVARPLGVDVETFSPQRRS